MARPRKQPPAKPVEAPRAVEEASALLTAAGQEPSTAVGHLEELLAQHAELALPAVAALGRVANPQAALALAAIADSHLPKDIRKEARRGLHRLRAAGVDVARPAVAEPKPELPVRPRAVLYDAWASAPDAVGSRALWLLAERPLGGIHAVGLVVNDVVGLKAAGFQETTKKRFEARLERWRQEEGATWVRLPPDYAAQLVGEALALNQCSGFPVPHEFQLHRDLIDGIERPFEGALVYREISPGAARLAPDWLQQSPTLLDEPELRAWTFDFSAVRPFAARLREAQEGRLLLGPEVSPERREQIVGEAIETVVTPELRQGLKRRLEEMGYVFLRTERPHQARLAVAAAVGLEEALTSRLVLPQATRRLDQHPWLRAMMARSLEIALEYELSGEALELLERNPYQPVE